MSEPVGQLKLVVNHAPDSAKKKKGGRPAGSPNKKGTKASRAAEAAGKSAAWFKDFLLQPVPEVVVDDDAVEEDEEADAAGSAADAVEAVAAPAAAAPILGSSSATGPYGPAFASPREAAAAAARARAAARGECGVLLHAPVLCCSTIAVRIPA